MAQYSPKPASHQLQPSLWPDLVASAHQARETTNAPGAAIALIKESAGEIVCYARSGTMAPELGTAPLVEDSLIGQCVRSSKQLHCRDAKTDTRVCSTAAAELAARSVVVTPIQRGSQVIGVLAVFSNMPDAFSPIHLARLKTIADHVAGILRGEQDQQTPVESQSQIQVLKNTPDVSQPDVRKPKPPLSAQLPISGKEARREPLPPVQILPVVEHSIVDRSTAPVPTTPVSIAYNFATLNAVAGQKVSQRKESAVTHRIMAIAVALLVIAGSATWASLKRVESSRADATSVQVQTAQKATPATDIVPQSGEPAPQTDAFTQVLNATSPHPNSDNVVGSLRKTEFPRKSIEISRGNTTSERAIAGLARSANTVDLASRTNQALLSATKEPTPVAADVTLPAPVSNAAQPLQSVPVLVNNTPPIAIPLEPAGTSKQSPLLKTDVVPARLIRRVPPQYPAFAQQMRTSGMVVVRARVAKDGRLTDPKFLSGPPIFRNAALDAVKLWQYAPATLNGQPVDQDVEIKLEFLPNIR